MSEESKETPAVTPAAPEPPKAKDAPPKDDPAWVGERLERQRKQIFKDLGIEDPEQAKTAIAAAKAAAEAKKSAEEKAAEAATQLKTAQTENERQLAILKEHAARMIGVLTAEQQAAVRAVAGEDPALQLKTIGALGPTWAAKAEAEKPATTAPPASAPAAVVPGAPPNHKTEYANLKATNPFAAAAYGLKNELEVYKS